MMEQWDDERQAELYEALRGAGDPQAIVALARREPDMLSSDFLVLVEKWIDQAAAEGNNNAATGLRQRAAVLLELQQRRAREAELPPLKRALMAFIRADDDSAAGLVFAQERDVLDTPEAQAAIEGSFRSNDAEGEARILDRGRLLQRLREGQADG